MRVTKHEHAALTIEEHGKQLIADPGAFDAMRERLGNATAD